ncbi:NACHT domain-containing NTPase [Corallococcus sp. CA054B]|uniref:NACHT domain-containing protein n=1 Tax=Corallococcus sp. CA054B TaxID=2316734 RepID=UPI0011C49D8B|nr:hypothetical protein [Corallococcus sp. CA054B]
MTPHILTQLSSSTFEHLINAIAMKVLGAGHTGFGPGPDGGRDGYFRGEAPYPSPTTRWSGSWYIQAKFHAPNLSTDHHAWLLERIREEIKTFSQKGSKRAWPDVWIIATNIDPSGASKTGSFDRAHQLVKEANPRLANRFDIWGGSKIIEFLSNHPAVAARYGHFLTPGNILSELSAAIQDERATVDQILRALVVDEIEEQRYTKLEQAGASVDSRPGVHKLFVDLPFFSRAHKYRGKALKVLTEAASQSHRPESDYESTDEWERWKSHPSRSPVWLIRGGPGNGKSTIGQYLCQIHRAALILSHTPPTSPAETRKLAAEIKIEAEKSAIWPTSARIPIYIELKSFAQWYGERKETESIGILTYLRSRLAKSIEQDVLVGTIRRMLKIKSWIVVFDGLDEVPSDLKTEIANEVKKFIRDTETESDLLSICTSRPQGYSGQFDGIPRVSPIDLTPLDKKQALDCAEPLVKLGRARAEAESAFAVLRNAIESKAVMELMTTPLQSHIMAVIVRDGRKPPERKWEMYRQFYEVIRTREASRSLPDKNLANLLQQDTDLLKAVHNKLGFDLHARAETATGAQASLSREEFNILVRQVVQDWKTQNVDLVVDTLMQATVQRLVLISTPDDGAKVRFDIRQLQEFFAAEYIYSSADNDELRQRLKAITGDAHWREVMHFILSAFVAQGRRTELSIAIAVLQELDEGGDGGHLRALSQRMAVGAIIVSKLIEDGVLEQNKGTRNLFRDRIAPLASLRDSECLTPLTTALGPESRNWVVDAMAQHVLRSKASESTGATILLWVHMNPGDSCFDSVLEQWSHSQYSTLQSAIESDAVLLANAGPAPDDWQTRLIFDLLSSSSAAQEGLGFFQSLYHIDEDQAHGWISSLAMIAEEKGMVAVSLMIRLFPGAIDGTGEKSQSIDAYGWAVLYPLKISTPSHILQKIKEAMSGVELTGVWATLGAAVCFAVDQTLSNLKSLLGLMGDSWTHFEFLPSELRSRIPAPNDSAASPASALEVLSGLEESEFSHLLSAAPEKLSFKDHWDSETYPNGGWQTNATSDFLQLLRSHPTVAIGIWRNHWVDPGDSLEKINHPDIISALESAWTKDASTLLRHPHIWGRIFNTFDNAGAKIRSTLLAQLRKSSPTPINYFIRDPSVTPFRLSLPSESPFLVPIASMVAYQYGMTRNVMSYQPGGLGAGMSNLELACTQIVLEYIGEIDCLRNIYHDISEEVQIRCAALTLSVLHPSGGKEEAVRQRRLILDLCEDNHRFGLEVTLALDLRGSAHAPDSADLIGSIFSISGRDGNTWFLWDLLLRKWREKSLAPISNPSIDAA